MNGSVRPTLAARGWCSRHARRSTTTASGGLTNALSVTSITARSGLVPPRSPQFSQPSILAGRTVHSNNNNNKRPLTPKSMPPAGDEHAKLKTCTVHSTSVHCHSISVPYKAQLYIEAYMRFDIRKHSNDEYRGKPASKPVGGTNQNQKRHSPGPRHLDSPGPDPYRHTSASQ